MALQIGGPGADRLEGGAGDDELRGEGGNDILLGGPGENLFKGAAGDDVIDNTEGFNGSISFRDAESGVIADLGAGRVQDDGQGGTDIIRNIVNVTAGGRFNDVFTGTDASNILSGGVGVDVMRGGAGDDIITVDDVGDIVIDRSRGRETDRINTFVDFVNPEGTDLLVGKFAENGLKLIGSRLNDSVTGSDLHDDGDRIDGFRGNDRLVGLAGDDFINGGAGNDRIFGNSGDDSLRGGGGNDLLSGQSGADRFIHRPGDGADQVIDFIIAQDVLDLSAHEIANFAEFRGFLIDTNAGVRVNLGGGDDVVLVGVRAAQLQEDDVILGA